ncbi:MAG TPA: hypothetical protein VI357_00760 [Mycobacteriales bacterium]
MSGLVEPEGVNAGSGEAMRDARPHGDPVPGGDPDAVSAAEPAADVLGAPPEGDADDVYGSEPPA